MGDTVIILIHVHIFVIILMLSGQGKLFSKQHFDIFFLIFPRKKDLLDISFHVNCLQEVICISYRILFSGENKKNTAELA